MGTLRRGVGAQFPRGDAVDSTTAEQRARALVSGPKFTTWGICTAPAPASSAKHTEWCGEDAHYMLNGQPRCRDHALEGIDELVQAITATDGVAAINVVGAASRAAFDNTRAARVIADSPGSAVFVLRCPSAHELHQTPAGAAELNNTPCPLCGEPMLCSCVLVAP